MKTISFPNDIYPDGRYTYAKQGEEAGVYDKKNLSSIIRYLITHMGINKDDIVAAHNRLFDRLKQLEDAMDAGRLVYLNIHPEEKTEGLKVKYRVFRVRDGSPVENCFVLRPDKELAAHAAMMTYSNTTANVQLAKELREWLHGVMPEDLMPELSRPAEQ